MRLLSGQAAHAVAALRLPAQTEIPKRLPHRRERTLSRRRARKADHDRYALSSSGSTPARVRPMSTVAFLNIAMHGHINPTLPVVAELVRRGHPVNYHVTPDFAEAVGPPARGCSAIPGMSWPSPARRRGSP